MPTIGRFTMYMGSALALLLGGCETTPVQRQEPVYYPSQPAPDYAYQEINRCRANNRQAHAEVVDSYERARQAGRIDAAEAQRFNAMEARLRNLRADLARDGISLQDCQRIGAAIERERNEVAIMSRSDPALRQCMADNRRAHQDVVAQYQRAREAGRINPAEAQRFNAIEGRLSNLRAELARDGFSMQDCRSMSAAIARERDEVTRMARYDPGVARCQADNRRAHEEVYRVYNDGVRSGRISAGESQRFQAIEGRLKNLQTDLRRDGLTLSECQRMGGAIARERAIVDSMLR